MDGTPNGVRTVELSNWIGKGICIPRSRLRNSASRPELQSPGLYFLFGQDEEGLGSVYIGEAETLIIRLKNHDSKKDFWNLAICFSSKDQNLTKADVKYLEARSVQIAQETARYTLQNSTFPALNNLPEYQVATMEEFLDNIRLLTAALGFPIMEKLIGEQDAAEKKKYYFDVKGARATGIYNENGFVVLAGSTCVREFTKSSHQRFVHQRKKLLETGVLIDGGEFYQFAQDQDFPSPSTAGTMVSASSINGWICWKDDKGKTLDENERQE